MGESYSFPLDGLEATLAPQDLTVPFWNNCAPGGSACCKEVGPPDPAAILFLYVYCINMVPQAKDESWLITIVLIL